MTSADLDAGDIPGLSRTTTWVYSAPVFALETDGAFILSGERPAVADITFDPAGRSIVSLRYSYNDAMLGGASYERSFPLYIRFNGVTGPWTFEVSWWNAGDDHYKTREIDPWERPEQAQVDLDDAADRLSGWLLPDRPEDLLEAFDLTFRMLAGWFLVRAIPEAVVDDWTAGLGAEVDERGVWTEGPLPWRRRL